MTAATAYTTPADIDALLAKAAVDRAMIQKTFCEGASGAVSVAGLNAITQIGDSVILCAKITHTTMGWSGDVHLSNGLILGTPASHPRDTEKDAELDAAFIVGLVRWGRQLIVDRVRDGTYTVTIPNPK